MAATVPYTVRASGVIQGKPARSHVELRVANRLDALSVDYLYEPVMVNLSTGERYLPDFVLPKQTRPLNGPGAIEAKDSKLLNLVGTDLGLPNWYERTGRTELRVYPWATYEHEVRWFGGEPNDDTWPVIKTLGWHNALAPLWKPWTLCLDKQVDVYVLSDKDNAVWLHFTPEGDTVRSFCTRRSPISRIHPGIPDLWKSYTD